MVLGLVVAVVVLLVAVYAIVRPDPVSDSHYVDERWGDGEIVDDWGLDGLERPRAPSGR